MTQHDHSAVAPGCYRCDLNRDEIGIADDTQEGNEMPEALTRDNEPPVGQWAIDMHGVPWYHGDSGWGTPGMAPDRKRYWEELWDRGPMKAGGSWGAPLDEAVIILQRENAALRTELAKWRESRDGRPLSPSEAIQDYKDILESITDSLSDGEHPDPLWVAVAQAGALLVIAELMERGPDS